MTFKFENLKTRTKIFVGMFSPLVLVLLLGGIAFYNVNSIMKTNKWVEHTYHVLNDAARMTGLAVDMETGMRGFLLTGDESFLDPYKQGEARTYSAIDYLRERVNDNPGQVERLDRAEMVLRDWQKYIAVPAIALRRDIDRTKTMDDLTSLVGAARGKKYFDQFRQLMGDFSSVEKSLMGVRQDANISSVRDTYILIGTGISLAMAIGLILAWITGRAIATPIKSMTNLMQRLAEGDMTIEVTGTGRGDEIGDMAEAVVFFKQNAIEADKLRQEQALHTGKLQVMVDEATHELKLQAQELERSLAKEQELNKLQREFISMASHEFRTPLAIIDATAQRMKSRVDKNRLTPEDAVRRVEKIRAAVKRMTRLMESTLDAARMEEGKVTIEIAPCDVATVVMEVCARQQEIAQTHIISCDLAGLPDTIQADEGALERIITNLLSNAVKYAPDAPDIEVIARAEGDQVVISVRDQGIGIDEDELDRIGERFFRARTSTGTAGTGIGLNLVKTLVEIHGGTVSVESKKGEGSTFTIRLPIAGPDQTEQADTRAA